MILIAFATNFKKSSETQTLESDLQGEPLENLLDTGFRSAKGKATKIGQETSLTENTATSLHPLDQLKNLFEKLQEELASKRLARKESLELETLIDLNALILKNLTNCAITTPLKELIVSAVTQQKEVLAEYLKDDSKTTLTKEQQLIKETLKNLDQNLLLISEQNTQAKSVPAVNSSVASEVILDPLSYSFHDRRTLVTATKEREQAELAHEKSQVELIRQEARNAAELRVLREYVARLDSDDSRINFVSALYQQRKDPAILTVVTEVLTNSVKSSTESQKNTNPELAIAS